MTHRPSEPLCQSLRKDIHVCAQPDDEDIDIRQKFYPEDALKRLLTWERVLQVLSCRCSNCTTRVVPPHSKDDGVICETIVGQHDRPGSGAILLFSLLVVIECPQLISGFFNHLITDAIFLEEASKNEDQQAIRQRYWPSYDRKQPRDSHGLATQFRWLKYNFAVPKMRDDVFHSYHPSTILPFRQQSQLGKVMENGEIEPEGAFGRVYSFGVVKGYSALDNFTPTHDQRYARKELPLRSNWQREKRNLESVQKLKDKHIVKLITAYKHGDSYNLVFPLARTNLDRFIRETQLQQPGISTDHFEFHPLWEQMLGVAKALSRIINGVPNADGENIMCGYHFDLKPANILIEDDGTCLVADFGQAMLRDLGGTVRGTSKVVGCGGTEAYAPPEISDVAAQQNRKYDVWSLGCIFLEVFAFIVGSYQSVIELDELRYTRSTNGRSDEDKDDNFWQATPGDVPTRYQVKPEVLNWMNSILHSAAVRHNSTKEFLKCILVLIKQMLSVNIEERLTCETVYVTLSGILKKYQEVPCSSGRRTSAGTVLPPDEVLLGKDVLSNLNPVTCFAHGQWFEGCLKLIESRGGVLRFGTSGEGGRQEFVLGPRNKTRIIPYQSKSLKRAGGTRAEEALTIIINAYQNPGNVQMYLHDGRESVAVLSVLLGQTIKRLGSRAEGSLRLESASFNEWNSKLHILHRSKASPKHHSEGNALAVQLWSETTYKDPDSYRYITRRDSPRTASEYLMGGAIPRRVVVYYNQAILIMHFAKNVRIAKMDGTSNERCIKFVPTHPEKDPSFTISLLRSEGGDQGPSLPLSRAQLDAAEKSAALECGCLTLRLESADDATIFSKAYRVYKKEWHDQETEIQNLKSQMGEKLGYSLI